MAKITKAEMPALAEQIVKCLGGKENVARINHCATRLRVNPVDMEKVDKDGLKRLHGVIGIDSSKAELQIIVGAIIEDLYLEVEKITGFDRKDIDKAFKDLKKEEKIVSPVRCKWEPAVK